MPEVWEWVDADGGVHPMNTGAARVLQGVQGRFMPPVDFVEDEVPDQPGARLRTVKTEARVVTVPMLFKTSDEASLRAALRSWLLFLHADRGDGKLRITGPDGAQRELVSRYAGGMDMVEDPSTHGRPEWQKAVANFRAVDPYWYDVAATAASVTPGVAPTFFPFFPLKLGAASVFGSLSVNNSGDVSAWPVWTITGPGATLVLSNDTTGKRLQLDRTLLSGDVVQIDTRPGAKTVKLVADGSNLYGSLASGSALWSLARGTNSVTVQMDNTTSESSIVLSYKRGYLGA